MVSFRAPGLTNLSSYQSRRPKGHDASIRRLPRLLRQKLGRAFIWPHPLTYISSNIVRAALASMPVCYHP
jgi:hypothetical protein